MAEPRATKLRRLELFRRKLPHVSASALATVLNAVEAEGIPSSHSRNDMRAAVTQELSVNTPYGDLVQDINVNTVVGGRRTMRIAHPIALLWAAFTLCPSFTTLMEERLAATPSTFENPWDLVLYSDEICPGDPLSADNRRKVQVIYFSFLQFGQNILCREDAWFCIFVSRSRDVNAVSGGMSHVFGELIKTFLNPASTDLSSGGMVFHREGNPHIRFWARLRIMLQDGAAHKSTWHCKGDGGNKLCMLCKNLFTQKCELVTDDDRGLLSCNVIEESRLDFASDQEIRDTVRNLAARHGTMPQGEFEALERSIGFVHKPHSLLLDRSLDAIVQPASQFMHDPMHGIFASGVFNILVVLLFEEFIRHGFNGVYEIARGYVQKWTWPKRLHGTNLWQIFSANRQTKHRKAKYLKCQASECLSLCAVLALFVQKILLPSNNCTAHCLAFIALCDLVDFLSAIPRGDVTSALVRDAVHKFLRLYAHAWGLGHMTPKFHWLLHFARHLEEFGTLLTCHVHERKHRVLKRYGTDIYNTLNYEYAVLSQVLCQMFSNLRDPETFNVTVGLVNPRPASRVLKRWIETTLGIEGWDADVLHSPTLRYSEWSTCSKGDVVLLDRGHGDLEAGKLLVNVSINGELVSIASIWDKLLVDKSAGYADWRPDDNNIDFVCPNEILESVVYCQSSDGTARTLLPCRFRQ